MLGFIAPSSVRMRTKIQLQRRCIVREAVSNVGIALILLAGASLRTNHRWWAGPRSNIGCKGPYRCASLLAIQ